MIDRRTGAFCPRFHRAAELVGRRWTAAIIHALLPVKGAARFGELEASVPGISARMLSERLRELEDEGVVERHVGTSGRPVVMYGLSRKGRALAATVKALTAWAHTWTHDLPSDPHDEAHPPKSRRS